MEDFICGGCMPSKLDGTEHILQIDDKLEIPTEYNLLDTMPPVKNQGASTLCVCYSLTAVLDYIVNSENGTSNICHNFSINDLYNIRANKRAPGMTIKEALHYLRHTGLKNLKIEAYSKVESINALKYALIMFGTCVAGMPCYSNIKPSATFWRKDKKNLGGHCITIVGYNTEGFIIRNSWGPLWANEGHTILPYNEFSACFEIWAIIN